jgi:hypothetical protein
VLARKRRREELGPRKEKVLADRELNKIQKHKREVLWFRGRLFCRGGSGRFWSGMMGPFSGEKEGI